MEHSVFLKVPDDSGTGGGGVIEHSVNIHKHSDKNHEIAEKQRMIEEYAKAGGSIEEIAMHYTIDRRDIMVMVIVAM